MIVLEFIRYEINTYTIVIYRWKVACYIFSKKKFCFFIRFKNNQFENIRFFSPDSFLSIDYLFCAPVFVEFFSRRKFWGKKTSGNGVHVFYLYLLPQKKKKKRRLQIGRATTHTVPHNRGDQKADRTVRWTLWFIVGSRSSKSLILLLCHNSQLIRVGPYSIVPCQNKIQ